MTIYFDSRWVGEHGIGRIATNLRNLATRSLNLTGNPASPSDIVRLSVALLRIPRQGLFLSPGYNTPLFSRVPFVFTLCDLNHIDRRENSSLLKRVYYSLILKRACHRAARVLTISEFSKRRIVEWAGISAEKVVNIGVGVGPQYRPDGTKFDPGYPYLLCVSNRRGHKNEFRIVEAFSQAKLRKEVRLIFTGHRTPRLLSHVAKCGVTGRVEFAGKVSEDALAGLYRGATALVFPSLYEGFGLPVVEAMACGTPVITSTTTSLPEAAGDAALFVNPESVREISAAITRLVSDISLAQELRDKGIRQASQFSWDRTTQTVRRTLESLAGSHG